MVNREIAPRFAFDLEGTLVNLERFHEEAWAHTAYTVAGVNFDNKQFVAFAGAGDKAISEAISKMAALGGVKITADRMRDAKNSVYFDLLHSSPIAPREDATRYLDQARVFGGDLVIASLTPQDNAEYILKQSRLTPFFSYILTEQSVGNLKPHPEVYIRAAELLGTPPANVIVHEDSPPGIKAAKAAGSKALAFPVLDDIQFDPQPDRIFLSWKGLDPKQIAAELFR